MGQVLPRGRAVIVVCLTIALLSNMWAGVPHGAAATSAWPQLSYSGATATQIPGRTTRISSYSLAYPPGWGVQQWPDTLAGYGQISLSSPAGETIDLILL